MSRPTTTDVSEHPTIRCLFEVRYDGTVSVISTSGCSDLDVYEVLKLLVTADWALGPGRGEILPNRPDDNTTLRNSTGGAQIEKGS